MLKGSDNPSRYKAKNQNYEELPPSQLVFPVVRQRDDLSHQIIGKGFL